MIYKDLIYKITSTNEQPVDMKKDNTDLNAAKQSVQLKDVLIGFIHDDTKPLDSQMLNALKTEIERTLTVLFNSPISDTLAFLPYSINTLKILLSVFPDKKINYIAEEVEIKELDELKKTNLNLKLIIKSDKKKADFANKIDYLVSVNTTIDPDMESLLKSKNVMIFPMSFIGIENRPQKEKHVLPDPSGWVYNSANGLWVKNWGWDGSQSIPSWKAPDDWNLNPNP